MGVLTVSTTKGKTLRSLIEASKTPGGITSNGDGTYSSGGETPAIPSLWYPKMLDCPGFAAKLQDVIAGVGDATILCVGDSTTMGVGGDDAPETSTSKPTLQSYPAAITAYLTAMGIPAMDGLAIPPNANNMNFDARWLPDAGWARTTAGMASYACYYAASSSRTLRFTPSSPYSCNAFDVYLLTAGASNNPGTANILPSGGGDAVAFNGLAQITDYGASGGVAADGWYLRKVRVSCGAASTSHYVRILSTSPNVWVVGVEPIHTTAKHVRVGNAGVGTIVSLDLSYNPFPAYPYRATKGVIEAYNPDLLLTSIGVNDFIAGVTSAQFKQRIQDYINLLPVGIDHAFFSPIVSNFNTTPLHRQLPLKYTLAAQALGVQSTMFAIPEDNEWWSISDTHPVWSGYKRMARSVLAQILPYPFSAWTSIP